MKNTNQSSIAKKLVAEVIVVCDSRTMDHATISKFHIFLKEQFGYEIKTIIGRTSKPSLLVCEIKQVEIFDQLTNIDPAKHHLRSMIEKAIITAENVATFFLLDPEQYPLPTDEKLQWAQRQIKEDLFLYYEKYSPETKNDFTLPPLHWIVYENGKFIERYLDDGDEVTETKILSPTSTAFVSNNELM